jgi:hypothetical protein
VKKHDAMMEGFDRFSFRMRKRYDQVRDCLAAHRYEEAHVLLTDIAVSHAKTSLSLRNVMVKDGLMEER